MIQIPRYEIKETLFTSTSTRVFRASQTDTGSSVIIRTCGSGSDAKSHESRMSFSFELLEMFNHPNIVKTVEFIAGTPVPFMVMEDTSSIDLRRFVEQFEDQQLPVQIFLDIAIQLAGALEVIHHAQVIHKDLHPGNIIINPETNKVQIIDFGLASLLSREQPAIVEPDRLEGVLSYISPEQTGRMNRALDYRSDFYTLGVTFYQLLTGVLPFQADDALGMVYAHMATAQDSVLTRRPGIPKSIALIIDKMMMKNAEDRYQSAYGLKYDLEHCRNALEQNGIIADFKLASEDVASRFCIPQTLYGRQEEIRALLNRFEQAQTGMPQLLTVAGYSGIGKSALVHEIYKPIAASNGVFVSGKFDQFQQNTPYSAIKTALANWLKQELRLPEAKLLDQRKRLLKALGANVSVLTEFMPEFQHLLGEQESPVALGSQETLSRFILVFQAFLKTVTEQRPWVLFIDDIQWADRGTLQLLPELLKESNSRLLIILAYRDNEVDKLHPAQVMLNNIAQDDVAAEHLKLAPLKATHIRQLITDTFHRTKADVEVLANLVITKTSGNPFFAIEFLKVLYRKGLVWFDIDTHCWTWELQAIERESITDNVVDLMLERMAELPSDTRHLMQIASCVGTRFDLATLAVASAKPLAEVASSLWQALKDGLLVQEGGGWFLGMVGGESQVGRTEKLSLGDRRNIDERRTSHSVKSNETVIQSYIPQCKFIHDRMLQAAYESLDEEARSQSHFDIGRRLYQSLSPRERKERIFDLVEQLNHGIDLLESEQEIRCLIELNTLAAEKAKGSSVWVAAEEYSSIALSLLGKNALVKDYELYFQLQGIKAESIYLSGDFDRAKACYTELVASAKDPLDKAELLTQQLVQSIGRSDYVSGIEYGRKALSQLGIDIPDSSDELVRMAANQQLELTSAIARCPIENFHNLPECKDRAKQLAIYLLVNFGLVGMLAQRPELVVVSVQKSVIMTIDHGRNDSTLITLTSYGLLMVVQDNYEEAAKAGEKARELIEIYPDCREAASVWNGIAVALSHIKRPIMDSYSAYERGLEAGLQAGELARVGVCISAKATIKAVAGYPLEETFAELRDAEIFVERKSLRVPFLPVYKNAWRSYLSNKDLLEDDSFTQAELKLVNGSSFVFVLKYFRFEYQFWSGVDCKALLSYLQDACDSYKLFKFHFMTVDLYTFANLAFIRCQREGYFKGRSEQFSRWKETTSDLLSILRERARLNPPACGHKQFLVDAEQHALDGVPFEQTAKLYKAAIEGAEENGFRQYAALANECFARYLRDIGFDALAETPLKRAYEWYQSWGNQVRLNKLSEESWLIADSVVVKSTNASSGPKLKPESSATFDSNINDRIISSTKDHRSLDFQSVVKSMQAISGELELKNLLKRMLSVIMENAGAQKAVLVIQSDKGPEVEAHVDIDKNESSYLQHSRLETSKDYSTDMINLSLRMGETIWLNNATQEGDFVDDLYVCQSKAKSILCLPIMYRNSRIGALYLENRLSAGVFTEERLSVLKVLLAQAAISLENARLFKEVSGLNADLEAKVIKRTQELDIANKELSAANKELESFSYTVSHDLKSPLRMIKGFSDILREDHEDQLDDEAKLVLGKVIASAKSMEELINGLLDLSRMQRQEVKKEPINLSDIAESIVTNLRDTYPERQVIVTVQPAMKVNGDARMMHSVVENLLNNAWKYSARVEKAQIDFHEALRYDDHGRPQRVFVVSDNGAGFDMNHADKLFSTFQRLHNKRDFDGTGVGLSTVKRIIDKHGGEIWAEAEVNQGATFYFTLA